MEYLQVLSYWQVDISDSKILYLESYYDWSWADILLIYESQDKIWINNTDEWEPFESTEEEAIQMMLDFEELLLKT